MQDQDADPPSHLSPFERIRQIDTAGNAFWSARDLALVLDYQQWRNFTHVLDRAMQACQTSGQDIADHFAETTRTVALGSGAARDLVEYHCSRYACYLIIQNADPAKDIVALGQTYFAIQTRRQEYTDAETALGQLTEDQKRLYLRGEIASHNQQLAAAAQHAGVVTAADFALFQDHGYMGLYGGLRARDIHRRKGLQTRQRILDHMGSTELAANLFRATQAEEKLRRDQVQGKAAANQTHFDVGQEVRATIRRLGGTMPESLPTPDASIQSIQQQERARQQRGPQLPLFPDDPTTQGADDTDDHATPDDAATGV